MPMRNKILYQYAKKLSRHIDDRRAKAETVEEIYSHLCDMTDSYTALGMTQREAELEAVKDMANPDDLGVQLDRVHTPKIKWWIYGLIILLLFSIIIGVFAYINHGWEKANQQEYRPDKEAVSYEKSKP